MWIDKGRGADWKGAYQSFIFREQDSDACVDFTDSERDEHYQFDFSGWGKIEVLIIGGKNREYGRSMEYRAVL